MLSVVSDLRLFSHTCDAVHMQSPLLLHEAIAAYVHVRAAQE